MTSTAVSANRSTEGVSWTLCPGCRTVQLGNRLMRLLWVCPDCGHHLQITAAQRIAALFDPDSVQLVHPPSTDTDPLEFSDTEPYPRRRERARRSTGMREAMVLATGAIQGRPLVAAVADFRFLGGSMGVAVGDLLARAAEIALTRRVPLLMVTASGGARMQEGVLSLMQMVRTTQALTRLDAAGVLTISLVTDPTFGGVAASYATLADVILAEPGARLGFAGPRVIEQLLGRPLPTGFQTAEALRAQGHLDLVCPRGEQRAILARLLTLTAPETSARRTGPDNAGMVTAPDVLPQEDPWRSVRRARDIMRPTTADYAARVFTDFLELHGDRLAKDCPAIIAGLARLAGRTVVLIGTQKGHTAAELSARQFGMASPAGYRKAARLMRLAAKLDVPVITLIDTPGAHAGIEAEVHGQALAIADNLRVLAELPVPVVAVITGEGGSGGALALAVADRVLMLANAVYSVISPEGCAAILWNNAAEAPRAAAALRVGARDLLRLGVVDGVIPEPGEGAQTDHAAAAELMHVALTATLAELGDLSSEERRRHRFRRFEAFSGSSSSSPDGSPDSSEMEKGQ
ncbi:acetyl-CoA carboxylase carboxyltransferase subunit alpha [Micromonospora matsumotoense]|uniref:Multifunctional fusion protein n=1 Tax=Micromonospora matsumotoense TaxID=121616 RepID=A0A1C5A2H6_9ACTN|nr:acetyl-CoA carboxylase carboxyltransferase subunit alpha/beta [Micromonospora matsumotoense]SCF39415.1 acetyl-CoA carboxylase carboxyltransferase subunit alpha [Micromonospora matsumotoense]